MATWRMVVRTQAPGMPGPGFSTWHWRDATVVLQDEAPGARTALQAFYTQMATQQGSGVSHFFDGRFVEVDGDRLIQLPSWTSTGTNNASPSDALSGALAVCVTWRSASNSRSGRGRTFLSGWREQHNDASGTPDLAVTTAIATGIQNLVAYNADTDNGSFVVYSPTQGIARDITGGSIRDVWAVLRSRRD